MYSIPRDLRTSTMKSDPGRSLVRISTLAGVPVSAWRVAASGAVTRGVCGTGCWACARPPPAVNTTALSPALCRKLRRFRAVFLDRANGLYLLRDRVSLAGQSELDFTFLVDLLAEVAIHQVHRNAVLGALHGDVVERVAFH